MGYFDSIVHYQAIHVDVRQVGGYSHIARRYLSRDWRLTAHLLLLSSPPGSVKFMEKIRYVQSLEELAQMVPMDHVQIPECVLQ